MERGVSLVGIIYYCVYDMKKTHGLISSFLARKCLLALFFGGMAMSSFGQKWGVKTNLLYDVTTTMNFGVEFRLAPCWTLDVSGNYNPWTLDKGDNKKMKHYLVQPEVRYWLCKSFQGHFFGVHAGFSEFNFSKMRVPFLPSSTRHHRYEGYALLGGVSYGYSWILGRRWNLEATVGGGYIYFDYDVYKCATCGDYLGKTSKGRWNVTKAGITLVYMIK